MTTTKEAKPNGKTPGWQSGAGCWLCNPTKVVARPGTPLSRGEEYSYPKKEYPSPPTLLRNVCGTKKKERDENALECLP